MGDENGSNHLYAKIFPWSLSPIYIFTFMHGLLKLLLSREVKKCNILSVSISILCILWS